MDQKVVDLQLPKEVQLLFLTALRVLQSTQRKARGENNLGWTGERALPPKSPQKKGPCLCSLSVGEVNK